MLKNMNASKQEDFSSTKTGYIDILRKLYGDAWITPSVLKNDIIKDELKKSKTKLVKSGERLKLNFDSDLSDSFKEVNESSVKKENKYSKISKIDSKSQNVKGNKYKKLILLSDSDSDIENIPNNFLSSESNMKTSSESDNNCEPKINTCKNKTESIVGRSTFIKNYNSSSSLGEVDINKDVVEDSQLINSSDLNESENNFEYANNKVVYVSDSDCETKSKESSYNLQNEVEKFEKKYQNDNFTPRRKTSTKKYKSNDSFIVDSSESSFSDDDFANTPARYNVLDALIQKSSVKSNSKRNLRKNNHQKLYNFDNSSEDDDNDDNDDLGNATICQVDDDEEVDELSEDIKSFKIRDDCYKKKLNKDNTQRLTFLESLSENIDINLCHKDALPYLKNFKRMRQKLSQVLFHLYNNKVFDNKLSSDMELIWCNSLRTTGGLCQSKRIYKNNEVFYKCSIKLSTKVVDRPCRLRDTLIHELCHAANFEIDRVRHAKHSLQWKYWTRKAEKCFPELPPIKTLHNYVIEFNFAFKCSKCYKVIYRHKKTWKENYCYCGGLIICQKRQPDGKYKEFEEKKPTVFAKFVQDNYKHVSTPDSTHKERMKKLSNLYAERKKLMF